MKRIREEDYDVHNRLLTTLQEMITNGFETFRTDEQRFQDHTIKFARCQHPAMGCRARVVVSGITC